MTKDYSKYLPSYEIQYDKYGDFYDCTVFSFLNTLETKLNKYFREKTMSVDDAIWFEKIGYIDKTGSFNFSDQFTAIFSNIQKGRGTTFQDVIDAVLKYGLVPESMFTDEPLTFEQYYDKNLITPEMREIGQEFLKRFSISWDENVGVNALNDELVWATIGVDMNVYNKNEVLPRNNQPQAHAVMLYHKNDYISMFDSYPPFLKRLALDYRIFASWAVYIKSNQLKTKTMKIIGDKSNMKDQYILGEDNRIYLIYNLETKRELSNLGIINDVFKPYWEDVSQYKRGFDIIMVSAE